jgi:aspartate aminotransferase
MLIHQYNEMVQAFHSRRDFSRINQRNSRNENNVPEGAFYVFPDVSSFFGKH